MLDFQEANKRLDKAFRQLKQDDSSIKWIKSILYGIAKHLDINLLESGDILSKKSYLSPFSESFTPHSTTYQMQHINRIQDSIYELEKRYNTVSNKKTNKEKDQNISAAAIPHMFQQENVINIKYDLNINNKNINKMVTNENSNKQVNSNKQLLENISESLKNDKISHSNNSYDNTDYGKRKNNAKNNAKTELTHESIEKFLDHPISINTSLLNDKQVLDIKEQLKELKHEINFLNEISNMTDSEKKNTDFQCISCDEAIQTKDIIDHDRSKRHKDLENNKTQTNTNNLNTNAINVNITETVRNNENCKKKVKKRKKQ